MFRYRRFFLLIVSTAVGISAMPAKADEPARPKVDFAKEIQPLLARRCFACHGPDKDSGGLRLNKRESALKKTDSGEHAIVPGKPDDSELLRRIASDDPDERMPPKSKPLTSEEIDAFRRWIAEGANWPTHWAFEPVRPQTLPEVQNKKWFRNPIDSFVLAKLEPRGLKPAPPAEPIHLLRRVYFDLTGLPPTAEAAEKFSREAAADFDAAYAKAVDELLASPRYGERWARHWLDVVRFAETNSFERDGVKPNAWRYRDYVIRSFNDDKPYDQFLREQLAGDELPEVTRDSIIATGFLRLGLWDDEPADPLLAEYDGFDDLVTTTSQAFLALTVNCARCHDHKIDPIPQADYYRMVALFRDLTPYGTRGDQTTFNQSDISPPEVREQYARLEAQIRELSEKMRTIEQRGIVKMPAEDQRKTEGQGREKVLREKLLGFLEEADKTEYIALRKQHEDARDALRKLPPREMALSVARCIPNPPTTHILGRGNPQSPGEEVRPGYPQLFESADPQFAPADKNARSAGRRLALANWMASPDNRLTARVMVNRIWQHHFGRGIVRSPNNFGKLGEPPTHPELLDWLAAEFVRGGWQMKSLHRLILLSAVYRQSTVPARDTLERDPANDLFSRAPRRRLGAEEIHDAILAVNGRLNLKMFGPGYYPELSAEVLAGQSVPGAGWGKSSYEEQARRAIYIHVKRSLVPPMLTNFDFPETDGSCEARFNTTQPGQALGMLNGDFVNKQAAEFASRLRKEAGDDIKSRITLAYRLAFNRLPTEREFERGLQLIARLQTDHKQSPETALNNFCLMVLNLNEFLYVD